MLWFSFPRDSEKTALQGHRGVGSVASKPALPMQGVGAPQTSAPGGPSLLPQIMDGATGPSRCRLGSRPFLCKGLARPRMSKPQTLRRRLDGLSDPLRSLPPSALGGKDRRGSDRPSRRRRSVCGFDIRGRASPLHRKGRLPSRHLDGPVAPSIIWGRRDGPPGAEVCGAPTPCIGRAGFEATEPTPRWPCSAVFSESLGKENQSTFQNMKA